MKIKTALNTFSIDGSIFKFLPQYGTATPLQMGLAYVLTHSGEKEATKLIKTHCDSSGHLTTTGIQTIAGILNSMFKDAWDKRYETLTSEYNPIENYNMTEHEEGNTHREYGKKTDTTLYGTKRRTEDRGERSGNSVKGEQINTAKNDISAFDSADYSKDRYVENTEGERRDNFVTNEEYRDEFTDYSYTDETNHFADDDADDFRRDLTRKGNIGVTTTQQMIEQELQLRAYKFFERMFDDIDSLISLGVYSDYEYDYDRTSGNVDTDIDVILTQLTNGVKISVMKNDEITSTATVYNGTDGITPDFKIEDGDLYVNP